MRGTVRPEAAIPEKALPAFSNWLQNEFGLQFFIGEAQISVCHSYVTATETRLLLLHKIVS